MMLPSDHVFSSEGNGTPCYCSCYFYHFIIDLGLSEGHPRLVFTGGLPEVPGFTALFNVVIKNLHNYWEVL